MRLRLATYNIHKFAGRDGKHDEERIAEILRAIDADAVALQEFVLSDKSGNLAEVEAFAARLGYGFLAQPMRRAAGMVQFNVLLTRLSVRAHSLIGLPRDGREPRGAIFAELDAGGKTLRVAATHLGLTPRARVRQLATLLDVCALERGAPFALLGDLNVMFPWEFTNAVLEKRFPGQRQAATFPARYPLLAFDRIYLRDATLENPVSAFREGKARTASDHLPLIADIAL